MNRSKLHNGGKYVRLRQSKLFDVGVQVPYLVDTKIQAKKAVCIHPGGLGAGDTSSGSLKRMQGAGRAYAHRSAPKYSVAQMMGYIKGKNAIYIAQKYEDRTKYFSGQHFWARGCFVSTIGRNE